MKWEVRHEAARCERWSCLGEETAKQRRETRPTSHHPLPFLYLHRSRRRLHLTNTKKHNPKQNNQCNFCLLSSNFPVCRFEALHFSDDKLEGQICHVDITSAVQSSCNRCIKTLWPLCLSCTEEKKHLAPTFWHQFITSQQVASLKQNPFPRILAPKSIIPWVIDGQLLLHVDAEFIPLVHEALQTVGRRPRQYDKDGRLLKVLLPLQTSVLNHSLTADLLLHLLLLPRTPSDSAQRAVATTATGTDWQVR